MTDIREQIDDYLNLRRALGYQLRSAEFALRDYAHFLDRRGETTVTTDSAVAWASMPADGTAGYLAQRLGHIRAFTKYLVTFDPTAEVPPVETMRAIRERKNPHIYTDTEVMALMSCARTMHPPARAAAFEILIGLLAATGLRPGEAFRLAARDVDLVDGVITVRDSKFHRSRDVPLHETTVAALAEYASKRERCFPSAVTTGPFIACPPQGWLSHKNVHYGFTNLLAQAAVVADEGRRPPRLHDFRHSFAVKTLRDWHRSGVDVQAKLPLLSTYLGHVNPATTYWYLSAQPELLRAAAERLEASREPAS
jgi:integrase/recombinase XerD